MPIVCVLPAVDDLQLSHCEEKQHVAPTEKQSIALLKGTNSKTYFRYQKEGPLYI